MRKTVTTQNYLTKYTFCFRRFIYIACLCQCFSGNAYAKSDTAPDIVKLGAPRSESTYFGRLVSAIYKEAFNRLNIAMQFEGCVPTQCGIYILQGKLDGELGRAAIYAKKYPELVRTSVSAVDVYASAFSRIRTLSVNSWDQLVNSNYKIAYIRGYVIAEHKIGKKIPASRVILVSHWIDGIEKLNNGEADIFIGLEVTIKQELKGKITDIKNVGRIDKVPLYAYFNKRHEHLVRKLSHTLKQMKKDGSIEKIYSKFDYKN